jgi:modulator of FtsH protease HflK
MDMESGDDKRVGHSTKSMQYISVLSGLTILCGVMVQSIFFTVSSDEVALVARFGRLVQTVGPGLHFKIPLGIDHIETVSTEKIRIQEFGHKSGVVTASNSSPFDDERSMITSDFSIVEIFWAIHYRIKDPILYVSSIHDPDRFLRNASESIIRSIVGQSDSTELFASSGQTISTRARDQIQIYLDKHHAGVSVTSIVIHEFSPPTSVSAALDRVDAARQEKEEMINNANQVAKQKLLEAKGLATRIVADAEAEALTRSTQALQETSAFNTAYQAFKTNPDTIKEAIYLDTLRSVLPKAGKIIVVQEDRGAPQSLVHLNEQKRE